MRRAVLEKLATFQNETKSLELIIRSFRLSKLSYTLDYHLQCWCFHASLLDDLGRKVVTAVPRPLCYALGSHFVCGALNGQLVGRPS